MKTTRSLGAAAIAGVLLLGGCSVATTTPVNPSASNATAAAPAKSGAAEAGQAVDKNALIKEIAGGAASVKTSTTTMEMGVTLAGKETTTKIVSVVDQSQAGHTKVQLDMGDGALQVVTDGDTYCMKMGGTWFKMTKAQLEKGGTKLPDTEDQATTLTKLESKISKIV